jgi:hypothetical protein
VTRAAAIIARVSVQAAPSSDLQQRLLDSLREDGIAVADVRELLGGELWAEALADVEPFVAEQSARLDRLGDKPEHKDEVIVRRYEQRADASPRFSLGSPWLRIGLSDAVLAVVNAYRGLATKLFYVDNWFTPPYAGADERIASQRWHRDPEEEHVVKTFLYLRDVDDDAGPFEYVRGSAPGNRYGHVFPFGGKVKNPSDDDLAAVVPADERATMRGPAGTMIFCDTSGFHRGGFARAKPRTMALWSYVSPESQDGRRFAVDLDGREAQLSAEARAALA